MERVLEAGSGTMGRRVAARLAWMAALFAFALILTVPSLSFAASWNAPQTVDAPGDVGASASLAVDMAGNPHIAYYDRTPANQDLKYAAFNGTTWDIEVVDGPGNVGVSASLALDRQGNPHIAYYDSTNQRLKYASKTGATWDIQVVDPAANAGTFPSLVLDLSGNPHISYFRGNLAAGELKYARFNGTAWVTEVVEGGGTVGFTNSLALDIFGNPHIAYYDATAANQDLKYATKSGAAWTIVAVDTGGDVGGFPSIALDLGGNPHISYYDVTPGNQDLKYAQNDGTGWSTQIVDAADDVGWASSLVLDVFGNPQVAYYDRTNGNLKYAALDGAAWSSQVVDATGFAGLGFNTTASLAPGSRNLHLAYYDSNGQNLRYVSGLAAPPAKAVERLWGLSSADTAIAISKEGWPDKSARAVILARDDFFTDALAGGPLAYKLRELYGNPAPILLTDPHTLYPQTAAEIERLGAEKVYILGGEGAIDAAVKNLVEALPGVTTERLWGATAYGTAFAIKAEMAAIAGTQGSPAPTTAVITTGENFPDALVISGPAAAKNMPILLVKPFAAEPQPETKLALMGITDVVIVGGPGAVHPDLEKWLNDNGYTVQRRLWGNDEYDTAADVAASGHSIFGFDRATTFVARGDFFTDALAGGPWAARLHSPMVLVRPASMPEITRLWITSFGGSSSAADIFKVYVLGGPGAVSDSVLSQTQTIIGP